MPRRTPLRRVAPSVWVSLLLFVGTALLFCRAIPFGFVNYDDPSYVTDNPGVQGGLCRDGIVWAFTAPTDYWHPLSWMSHMLDWQLFGDDAVGHHATSVIWHALNAVLAFLVFRRLAGGLWASAFAAALFAWHPLRVESVVWVTERKDVMSGCFFFLTLLAYARYVDRRTAARSWWRAYGLTLACFVLGLMSKPMLVTVPLVLLILDFWPFARHVKPGGLRVALVEKVPFLAISGAVAVITVLMQHRQGSFVLELPFGARAGNAVVSVARYLGKFVWPFDLVVFYPHPGFWSGPIVAAAWLLVLGLSGLAWWQRTSRPWVFAGWLWLLVVLLPVVGLLQVGLQSMADRYTYLALIGAELALVWSIAPLLAQAPKGVRAGATCAAGAVLLGLAARTWDQQGVWRDSVALFEHAAAVTGPNDVAEDFLGSALFAAGRMDEAAVHAERACALNPRNATALASLGSIREQQGRTPEARGLYRASLELQSDNHSLQCQLGRLEFELGHVDEARRLMMRALGAAPKLRERTLQLAQAASAHGDAATAGFLFEVLLALEPNDPWAHAGVAEVLLARNDPVGGLEHLHAAVAAAPGRADLQLALARCALQLGRTEEAAVAIEHVLADATEAPAILSAAAEICARQRDFARAASIYRRVVAAAPGDAAAHAALGYVLILGGDRAAGLAAWRRALELDPGFPGLRERLAEVSQQP